jgi:hypothetical protein
MSGHSVSQALVVVFDVAGAAVEQEMSLADFERLRKGETRLIHRAGESARAAYVTVGPGLRITGLVFFLLPFDPAGAVLDSFSVPLQYLADFAGIRNDLGIGAVQVASRAQCPVPWLALKLWEPDASEAGPVTLIQRTVLLNRLGLSSNPKGLIAPAAEQLDVGATARVAVQATGGSRSAAAVFPAQPGSSAEPVARSSTATLAAARHEWREIEQGYLEQIRKYRAELIELKSELRLERDRNRRLQALLRGSF